MTWPATDHAELSPDWEPGRLAGSRRQPHFRPNRIAEPQSQDQNQSLLAFRRLVRAARRRHHPLIVLKSSEKGQVTPPS